MKTATIINTETTALILAGEGYRLTIDPEAIARKAALLDRAGAVTTVTSNDESSDAQFHIRALAAMRIEVEKSRKEVKEPVNRVGKLIDQAAKDFTEEIDTEEARIRVLVGHHAELVAAEKVRKVLAEREAFELARATRETADAAATIAETTNTLADAVAARQAVFRKMEALVERMEASAEVAETKIAVGVRFTWEFEVTDINQLAEKRRDLVDILPRRSVILAALKALADSGESVELVCRNVGLRVFKKPIISSK